MSGLESLLWIVGYLAAGLPISLAYARFFWEPEANTCAYDGDQPSPLFVVFFWPLAILVALCCLASAFGQVVDSWYRQLVPDREALRLAEAELNDEG